MSLEYILRSNPAQDGIIDTGFYSLNSTGSLTGLVGDFDEVLTLRTTPGNPRFWKAGFENPPPGVNAVYNHNAMMKIRTANYASPDNIFLDSFVYTPPSWIQISDTYKAFTISQIGIYFITMTFETTTTNSSANIDMTLGGTAIGESIISFIPSNIDIDGEPEKISCTSSFMLNITNPGFNTLTIRISPFSIINLQGASSFVSIQQLTKNPL